MKNDLHHASVSKLLVALPFGLAACGQAPTSTATTPTGTPTESSPDVATAAPSASAVASAAPAAAATPSTPASWIDFADPTGRYTARFPGAPESKVTSGKQSKTETTDAIVERRLFGVTWLTIRVSSPQKCEDVVRVHLTANVAHQKCTGSEEKAFNIDGAAAGDITLSCPDGMNGRWRAICLPDAKDPLTYEIAWIQAMDRNDVFDRKLAEAFIADAKLKKPR